MANKKKSVIDANEIDPLRFSWDKRKTWNSSESSSLDKDTGVCTDGTVLPIPPNCEVERSKFASGKKYDSGKLRYDLIPWEAVEPLADILTFGSQKYGDNSWQRVENAVERYKAALFRHLIAWCKGERKDPESGRSHLHHVLTNCVFLIWFELHGYCSSETSCVQPPVSEKVPLLVGLVKKKDFESIIFNDYCSKCTCLGHCTEEFLVLFNNGNVRCLSYQLKGDDSSLGLASVNLRDSVPVNQKVSSTQFSSPDLFVEVGRSNLKVADVNAFCSSCSNCEVTSRSDRRYGCRLSCRYLYLNEKDRVFYCPQRDLTHDAH